MTEFRLEINTIGDAKCRPGYVEELVKWLRSNDHLLDDEAREKREDRAERREERRERRRNVR